MRSDDVPFALMTLLPVLVLLGLLVSRLWKRSAVEAPPVRVQVVEPGEAEGPRCVACGDLATHSMPRLARGRGSAIEDYFGMAPRYHRVVEAGAALTLCRSHAGVADSELASFVATEVRAPLQKALAQVAGRVAAFEAEELMARVAASLTEAQRRAAKRVPAPRAGEALRLVQKSGTDE